MQAGQCKLVEVDSIKHPITNIEYRRRPDSLAPTQMSINVLFVGATQPYGPISMRAA